MTSLKEKYKDYFKVGAAVSKRTVKSHAQVIAEQFNSITCENEMKYSSIAPEEERFNFGIADDIMEFARDNQMAVRGHTFVWHNQTPEWVFRDADRNQLLQRIRNHMIALGGRYNKEVFAWDVVNEAIEDKADEVLRRSKWFEILGESFMDDIFLMAKEILPDKELYYNDYNETNPIKRQKIYNTIKNMRERGIPVDGIGMQCHHNIYEPSADELKRAIELYAELGVKLHITEMDVSLFEFNDHGSIAGPTAELIEKQASVYEKSFKIFREYKEHIDCVTIWGVADDATWLDHFPARNRKNWPLLFDEEHNPKEAFYRIMEF